MKQWSVAQNQKENQLINMTEMVSLKDKDYQMSLKCLGIKGK